MYYLSVLSLYTPTLFPTQNLQYVSVFIELSWESKSLCAKNKKSKVIHYTGTHCLEFLGLFHVFFLHVTDAQLFLILNAINNKYN